MNNQAIIKILHTNGLSEKESRTYIAMLTLGGNLSPYEIAKRSGLKAPITYVILDSLLQKGLVLKTPFQSGWRFRAKKIDDFLDSRRVATERLFDVSTIINSYLGGSEESKILVFEGIKELRSALWYKLDKTKNFVAFYGSAKNVSKDLSELFIDWYKDVQYQKLTQKIIAPKDVTLSSFRTMDSKYGNQVKEVDSKIYDSESSIEIHEDFIRIVMLKQEKCVIIEDKNLAAVLRNIFELVWKIV